MDRIITLFAFIEKKNQQGLVISREMTQINISYMDKQRDSGMLKSAKRTLVWKEEILNPPESEAQLAERNYFQQQYTSETLRIAEENLSKTRYDTSSKKPKR